MKTNWSDSRSRCSQSSEREKSREGWSSHGNLCRGKGAALSAHGYWGLGKEARRIEDFRQRDDMSENG